MRGTRSIKASLVCVHGSIESLGLDAVSDRPTRQGMGLRRLTFNPNSVLP